MNQRRRIYTSFHDIPPREYMYIPRGTIEVSKPGQFSKIEIRHLFISLSVLTLVFAFVLTENNLFYILINGAANINKLPYGMLLSFLGIGIAFFFHELSHKFMAQKYGLWSEYRMYPQGLKFALFLGIFTPLVFAAPGAVMFRGGSRDSETGQIAIAGPLANIIIASITLPLYLFIFYETETIGDIIGFICYINALLAAFNLLPFGPLDGTKIIRWNATVWIILLIIAFTIFIRIFTVFRITI